MVLLTSKSLKKLLEWEDGKVYFRGLQTKDDPQVLGAIGSNHFELRHLSKKSHSRLSFG